MPGRRMSSRSEEARARLGSARFTSREPDIFDQHDRWRESVRDVSHCHDKSSAALAFLLDLNLGDLACAGVELRGDEMSERDGGDAENHGRPDIDGRPYQGAGAKQIEGLQTEGRKGRVAAA